MNLPKDIKKEINRLFRSRLEREEVRRLLKTLWAKDLNIGSEQLARTILIIVNKNLVQIQNFFQSDFQQDPKDTLAKANSIKPSCQYGINKFLEISNIKWIKDFDYGLITAKDVYISTIDAKTNI